MRNSLAALIIAIVVIIAGIAGYAVGTTLGTNYTTTTTMKNIGNVYVNGTENISGNNLSGTLEVVYPNSAESGNINASITEASVTFHCNNSFFTINADSRVIVDLTIIGNENNVFMDGMRLNLTINGNLNKFAVMPETVTIYGKQINGTGNQITLRPLPP
ncbi:MAG: hypothetical protein JRN52_03865 [Nitrososphaerota archaeon]|nr:hypothetical protein [Nitrososphaerota archaeon]